MYKIKDQLEAMSRSSVFLIFGLEKGYHQMKLAEEPKEITAYTKPMVFPVEGFDNGKKDLWSCVPYANGCNACRAATLLFKSICDLLPF